MENLKSMKQLAELDPTSPAKNGVVLLFAEDLKREFRIFTGNFGERLIRLESQLKILTERVDALEKRFDESLFDRRQVKELQQNVNVLMDHAGRLGVRMEALEERMNRLDARMLALEDRIEKLELKVSHGFARMEEKFAEMDKRFEAIDKKFEAIDRKFEAIDKRFEAIDERFEKVDRRFVEIELEMREGFRLVLKRIDDLAAKVS